MEHETGEFNQAFAMTLVGNQPLSIDRAHGEAAHRVQLIAVWKGECGYPSVEERANLELMQLRIGMTPERAGEIEHEVRTALARDALVRFERAVFRGAERTMTQRVEQHFSDVVDAYRWDTATTFAMLTESIHQKYDSGFSLWRSLCAIFFPQMVFPSFSDDVLWGMTNAEESDFRHFLDTIEQERKRTAIPMDPYSG